MLVLSTEDSIYHCVLVFDINCRWHIGPLCVSAIYTVDGILNHRVLVLSTVDSIGLLDCFMLVLSTVDSISDHCVFVISIIFVDSILDHCVLVLSTEDSILDRCVMAICH